MSREGAPLFLSQARQGMAPNMKFRLSSLAAWSPGTQPVVTVLQEKQLSTANTAADPIQVRSVFKKIIEFK